MLRCNVYCLGPPQEIKLFKVVRLSIGAALLAATGFGAQTLAAATVYVGSCGPAKATSYTTIQQAVNASPAGSTVYVCPGTYPEQVTITRNLNLIGVQSGTADSAVITSPASGVVQNTYDLYEPPAYPVAAQVLVQKAQSVNIANITVDGSNNQLSGCGAPNPIGIYYQNSSGKITDDAVRNVLMDPADQGCQLGLAINVESNTGAPAITSKWPRHRRAGTRCHGHLEYSDRSRCELRPSPRTGFR